MSRHSIAAFTLIVASLSFIQALYLFIYPNTSTQQIAFSSIFWGIFTLILGYFAIPKKVDRFAKQISTRRRR